MIRATLSISAIAVFLSLTVVPEAAYAQNNLYNPNRGYNYGRSQQKNMYNRVMKGTGARYPGQKRFEASQAEIPMLDVDAIVAREQAARRRQQQQQRATQNPRSSYPRTKTPPRTTTAPGAKGCGIYGIHGCDSKGQWSGYWTNQGRGR